MLKATSINAEWQFGEKDSVTSWVPTIIRLQIRDRASLQFLFLMHFGQWVHTSSCSPPYLQIFVGDLKKLKNWDPMSLLTRPFSVNLVYQVN